MTSINRKKKEFVCVGCGKKFIARADHNQKFCSRQCFGTFSSKQKRKYAVCPVCNKEFVKKRSTRKYCSAECQRIGRSKKEKIKCDFCGKEFFRVHCHISEKNFCSKACQGEWNTTHQMGENAPRWKGGSYHGSDGYIYVKQPDGSYKSEHRINAEKMLGRPLTETDVVHHKDGNKTNNSFDNLEVVTRREHILIHKNMNGRS